MLATKNTPPPTDHVGTLNWRNTCLYLHQRTENHLCSLLGVTRHGLDQELLQRRSSGLSIQERQAWAEWQEAEANLDQACSLFEQAVQLRQDALHRNLDE